MGNKIDIRQIDDGSEERADITVIGSSKAVRVNVLDEETAEKRKNKKTHYLAANKPHRSRQKSQTLRRSGVKKPKLRDQSKLIRESQGALYEKQIDSGNLIIPKDFPYEENRARAEKVSQNKLVKRFNRDEERDKVPTNDTINAASVVQHIPLKEQVDEAANDSIVNEQSTHNVPKSSRVGKLFVITALMIIFILLIGGSYFFAPLINFRFVSNQAAFSATLPNGIPAGYKLNNKIVYAPGQMTLSYYNGPNSFTITEQPYQITDSGLSNQNMVNSNMQFQTIYTRGEPVYIFSDGSAAWANNNIWYMLRNTSDLSSNDIYKIASQS